MPGMLGGAGVNPFIRACKARGWLEAAQVWARIARMAADRAQDCLDKSRAEADQAVVEQRRIVRQIHRSLAPSVEAEISQLWLEVEAANLTSRARP
jgi:hypothetical protein